MAELTLRIRTQIGTWRLKGVKPADTFGNLKRMLEKEHSLDLEHVPLTEDPSGKTVCPESKTVAQAKLSNGHMLYMKVKCSTLIFDL